MKWATPSGGVSYANVIDAPPTSPNAKDDEFSGTTLDAKWSWVNQGASTTISVASGVATITFQTQAGAQAKGLVQPIPASTDFTAIVSVLESTYWQNYTKFNILVSESLTTKQFMANIAYENGNHPIFGEFYSIPTTRTSYVYYGPNTERYGYIKVRVYQTAGVWYVDFYYSRTGRLWTPAKTGLALGFTPGYIGFGGNNENATYTNAVAYDWFRVTQ